MTARRFRQVLRRHRVFAVVVSLGVVMRVLVQLTYWPAMWNSDSHGYFRAAESLWVDAIRPSGFGYFMHYVPEWHRLWPVAALQHTLAVAVAVALYVVLQRWGVAPWVAALATVPLLLDHMQLSLEQFMLSDVLAQLLVVTACILLLWRRRIGVWHAGAAGLLLGAASTVRTVAEPLILIACVWVLVVGAQRWRAALALLAAAALPLGSYVWEYHSQRGVYATSSFSSHYLYVRVGLLADCRHLDVPDYEERLCLHRVPPSKRTANLLLWQKNSPPRVITPPAGQTVESVLADFDRRVITQQPVRYARAVTRDSLRAFFPTRHVWFDNQFDNQWFLGTTTRYESRSPESQQLFASGVSPEVRPGLARITSHYGIFVPGPVSAVCLVVALACALGYRRAREQVGARVAAAALTLMALASFVVPAATALFCWRYQIIQLTLLPTAAALGLAAITRGPVEEAPDAGLEA